MDTKSKQVDNRTPKQKAIDIRKVVYRESLVNNIIQHEGLVPLQTPFRITSDEMRQWNSMFDDSPNGPLKLNKDIKKAKGRENFLYVTNQDDVFRAINEQLQRYIGHPNFEKWRKDRGGNPTVADAIRLFDQTGADDKLAYLKTKGIDTNTKLKEIY